MKPFLAKSFSINSNSLKKTMKKVFFGLAFLGSVLMFNQGAKAQSSEPGEGGNSSGGVCCQSEESCRHPKYGLVADATWIDGIKFCS
jgi:hypothetical protein